MTHLLVALLLALTLLPSRVEAQWTNEPSGSSVLINCPMVTALSCNLLDVYGSLYSTSESLAGQVSAPSVLNSRLFAGQINGGSQVEHYFSQTYSEIYMGMVLRSNTPFDSFPCCANKMFFLRGPGTNGFFGMEKNVGSAQLYFGHNTGGGLDNSHVCSGDLGLGGCTQNVNSAPLVHGAYHKLEVYMRKSTTATSRDGILRMWNNGTKTMEYTTLNYPGGFNNWIWTETYGGATPVAHDRIWTIDHVYLSVPNCPTGCVPPPPGPPPPPPSPPSPPPSSGDYVFQSQFSGTQGTGQWSYRDTAGNLLTYNSGSGLWTGSQLYLGIWSNGFHPGSSNGAVLRWTAPANGTATIAGGAQKLDLACGDGATFQVKYGATVLFTKAMAYNDGTAYPYSVSQAMTSGQTIDFIVTPGATNNCDSSYLNPGITWVPSGASTPTITSFLPTSGAVATSVVITGTNFIPSLSGQTVTFGGIAATVLAATATSITARVPPAAVTGPITVTTINGTATSGSNFTVPLSGAVETVNDVTASALSSTSVTVRFTALSDGTGAAAKHNVRIMPGVIAWGDAPAVSAGTCVTPFAPAVVNTVVTCTITGLTQGQQYDVQLVPYRGTINVDAVYGEISNIATVTPMGTVPDPTDICRVFRDGLHPVSTRCLNHSRGLR